MADDLDTSLKKIKYCHDEFNPEDGGGEDAANHLISFSLPKIIYAFERAGVGADSVGIRGASDSRLRQMVRYYQEQGSASSLLGYLRAAHRAGLRVNQIDTGAWVDALNFITSHFLNFAIDEILLFDKPLNFVKQRIDIELYGPDNDIVVDAEMAVEPVNTSPIIIIGYSPQHAWQLEKIYEDLEILGWDRLKARMFMEMFEIYDMASRPEKGDALDHIQPDTPLIVALHLYGMRYFDRYDYSSTPGYMYNQGNYKIYLLAQEWNIPLMVMGDQPEDRPQQGVKTFTQQYFTDSAN